MAAAVSVCVKGKKPDKSKKKHRFFCPRCGMTARKKKRLCKAKKIPKL